MKKMKVAHIITRLILGGAQENTLLTVDGLRNYNYDVTLITGPSLSPEGNLFELAKEKKIKLILIKELRREINFYYDTIAFFKILFLFLKEKYKIVHTHSSKAGILGRIAAKLTQTPIIIHTIHGLPFHNYQKRILKLFYICCERLCSKLTDKIITVADVMIDKAVSAKVAKRNKFITIRSGMELKNFLELNIDKIQKRKEIGISNSNFVITKIARLFELKGHNYVIEAANKIVQEIKEAIFLFVGDGILMNKLKQKISEKNLDTHFIFYGLAPREQIPELIGISDIIVHTSLREGLARVLVQGLAMAKPVISFDIDGAKEVIINEKTGLLIPVNSNELANAVIKLYQNKEMREKLGEKGRNLIKEEFTTTTMVKNISDLYQTQILKKGLLNGRTKN